jgi:ligand-binding sensor domain-containing protein/serine phosphatase RsbU (regulator of sigma subunit)
MGNKLLFHLLLMVFIGACAPEKRQTKPAVEPLVQAAGSRAIDTHPPQVVFLNTRPEPLQIEIPVKTSKRTVRKSGRDTILQLAAPISKPAHFFAAMPNYNTEQGLALSSISQGYCDRQGNLWFCTEGAGVSRFDGKSFTSFNSTQGLANDVVWCVQEDKAGNIWFGTERGISLYDGFLFHSFTTKDGLANNAVYCIEEDAKGRLWFGTAGGLSLYDPAALVGGVKKKDGNNLFSNFGMAEGLSSNKIWSIKEDSRGVMWLGTQAGLSYYIAHNGVGEQTTRSQGLDNSMHFRALSAQYGVPENVIRDIEEDQHGNIWFATYNGLCCLSQEGWHRLKEMKSPPEGSGQSPCFVRLGVKEGLAGNAAVSVHADKVGNIWCGTYGNGLSLFRPFSASSPGKGSFTTLTVEEGLCNNGVKSIVEDKSGAIWISTEGGGVNAYLGNAFVSYSKAQGLAEDLIWSILQDKNGNFVFGTNGEGFIGFNAYDDTGKRVFTNFKRPQGLAFDFIWSILKDKKGDLWFGTFGGGVCRYDGKNFITYTTEQGLCDNNIKCITEDKAGNLWFGSLGKGLSCFDGKRFVNYTKAQGLVDNNIWSIAEGSDGSMWFATNEGLSRLAPDTTLSGLSVRQSFISYTSAQGLPNNQVLSITKDSAGMLWFGSNGGGISRYDGKSFLSFNTNSGLCDNGVTSSVFDKSGNLAIGTNSGIAMLTGFRLPGNTRPERTSNTLSNAELKGMTPLIEVFTGKLGYPVKDVNTNSMYCDDRGLIWAGTGDKVIRFDYKGVLRNPDTPHLTIQSLKLNNENICWTDLHENENTEQPATREANKARRMEEVNLFGKLLSPAARDSMRHKFADVQFRGVGRFYPVPDQLVLPHSHNNVTFEFAAIEPARPYRVRYRYYLEGYDNEWNPLTDKTTATFGNINEGTYTFKVKACSPDGVWSQPLAYVFKVLPPWYRSWWAYLLYSLSGLLLIGGFVNYRLSALRKEKEFLEQKVEERTEQLRLKNDLVEKQKGEVEKQKDLIEEKQKKILSSITYAKRIQDALLKEEEHVSEHLPQHFVIFRPKDIVSGDFYWAHEKEGFWYVAAVDCTGHGVPGAFMSMLGVAFLNEINAVTELLSPAQILEELREKVVRELCQKGPVSDTNDGMDISLVRIDLKTNEVQWAGAYNSLYIINAKGLNEIKADRQPIGYYQNPKPFTNHIIRLESGDELCLFTDGFADQQNSQKVRITRKRFKELLLAIQEKPMHEQKNELINFLSGWKGNRDQTDDICIIGIQV